MTKFESCAKGADRRGAVVAEDVLLGDAYDVPDDGVEVDAKTGELRAHRDDDETTDAERVALAKARATTTGAASAHRVFVDVVKTDASDACEPTATVVMEFHAHDEDSTTNAARALEWFDNAFETRTSGQSYVGAGVRVIENGKILQIEAPIAYEATKKTKRATTIREVTPRDAWLDEGEVRVFLGASAASSAALKIPERATYLGKASESSFINLVDAISRSMDIFIRDGAARVGVCGALLDERGGTRENTLVDLNRKRVELETAKLHERNETVDATKKRLAQESEALSDRVRDAVLYASRAKKAKERVGGGKPTWDILADESDSDSDSDNDRDVEHG